MLHKNQRRVGKWGMSLRRVGPILFVFSSHPGRPLFHLLLSLFPPLAANIA
ncbi:conserved hypothetical protein [Ricinus communis]|uniref:Uncharacterized protein n=1 Tax=Ricinus communis TaxID=3988 RepID=B9S1G0_RICCO|nr:conserved hypothetical protein [Ricinus communis]